jgi:hypothetical protein
MADQKVSNLPALNGADVDSADLLYIVDSSAGTAGSKKITIGQYQLAPVSGGTANGVTYLNASKVQTSGSALTFDGTNLGVGTSSPSYKLDVLGSATESGRFRTSGAINALYLADSGTTAGSLYIGTVGNSFRVVTGSNETLRLDSSGNLGLGVTPSAWANGFKAFEIAGAASVAANGPRRIQISTNVAGGVAGDGSGGTYATSFQAARYQQVDGVHYWFTAPSGTAGNAITFTQAMTLDASGNLGVGTSSPATKLHVNSAATDEVARFEGTGNPYISVYDSGTRQLYFGSIGASDVDFWVETNKNLRFATNNTERARITSGGDLLVGTTTLSDVGNSIFGSSVPGVIHQNNNAASNGFVFTSYRRSSVEIGSVSQNGTTAVLYNTTSDRRLKDNIVPAPSASDVIDAIQIVSHGWKSAPDEQVKYGVIAQDLHAVAPQAVLQGDDGDEIEKTWGVDYSKLVPMLIKEIQSLRARVAALEAK